MKYQIRRFLALVSAAAVLLGVLMMSGCGSAEAKALEEALEALESGDYDTIGELLEELESLEENEELIHALKKHIRKLESEYDDEEMEYEDVIEALEDIEALDLSDLSDQLEETLESVEKLHYKRSTKTVWLKTSQTYISYSDGEEESRDTYEWDYDEAGRLTRYYTGSVSYMYEYHYDIYYSISYDEQGNISMLGGEYEYESDYSNSYSATELYPTYEGNLLTGYTGISQNDDAVITYEYDENGFVSKRTIMRESDGSFVNNYQYDPSGILRERESFSDYTDARYVQKYDENGYFSEYSVYYGSEQGYYSRYVINEKGHLCGQYYHDNSESEPYSYTEITYEYDEQGLLTYISWNKNGSVLRGSFTVEGNTRTAFLTSDTHAGNMTLVLEYDDAGNLLHYSASLNGEPYEEATYTYISLELPADYTQPSINNPLFMIN